MSKRVAIIAGAAAVALYAPVAVHGSGETPYAGSPQAQSISKTQQSVGTGQVSVASWDEAHLRNGFSAERLLGMDVRGSNQKTIGEVRDILFTRDARVQALIVSAGGVLGVGDTSYRVPWHEARFDEGMKHVSVPISNQNVERFRWGADKVQVRANELRAREVMQTTLVLRGDTRYGEVDDLIIGRDGRVKALVVSSVVTAYGQKRYAFPFSGDLSYRLERKELMLPYTAEQLASLRPFDYTALGIASVGVGSDARP